MPDDPRLQAVAEALLKGDWSGEPPRNTSRRWQAEALAPAVLPVIDRYVAEALDEAEQLRELATDDIEKLRELAVVWRKVATDRGARLVAENRSLRAALEFAAPSEPDEEVLDRLAASAYEARYEQSGIWDGPTVSDARAAWRRVARAVLSAYFGVEGA